MQSPTDWPPRGASLVVNDLNADAAEQTAAALRAAGHAAWAVPGDVASSQDVRGIVAAALDRYGQHPRSHQQCGRPPPYPGH